MATVLPHINSALNIPIVQLYLCKCRIGPTWSVYRALTRLPTLPNSRIGELLPHHWISADYSLPSWSGQVQTELPAKGEGDEHQAQER
jgi:hypothetical protein